jgi:hypothetical protein
VAVHYDPAVSIFDIRSHWTVFSATLGHNMLWGPTLTNKRTLLLIDNSTHHHGIFRDAIANAIGGPFEGEWVTTLAAAGERLKRNGI